MKTSLFPQLLLKPHSIEYCGLRSLNCTVHSTVQGDHVSLGRFNYWAGWPCIFRKTSIMVQGDHVSLGRLQLRCRVTMYLWEDFNYGAGWPCRFGKTCTSSCGSITNAHNLHIGNFLDSLFRTNFLSIIVLVCSVVLWL